MILVWRRCRTRLVALLSIANTLNDLRVCTRKQNFPTLIMTTSPAFAPERR